MPDFELKKKVKTKQEIEDENVIFKNIVEKQKKQSKKSEVEVLERFWGDES